MYQNKSSGVLTQEFTERVGFIINAPWKYFITSGGAGTFDKNSICYMTITELSISKSDAITKIRRVEKLQESSTWMQTTKRNL